MSVGYSLRLRDTNKRASSKLLGVRLGRVCIKEDVPAAVVAQRLGVSRQTVYNWFRGVSNPAASLVGLVENYIAILDQ
jgi:transcriptional regulator with XRE-family HTH domain